MSSDTAYGTPIIVATDRSSTALQRVPLSGPDSTEAYDERWLQQLLYEHPQALPISEIDESFSGLIPLCQEMNTPAGPIDIVFITPAGRLVIVEAKLWRNPEARREVVGQILDYAKEFARLGFDSLDAAVRSARRREDGESQPKGLIELVRSQVPNLDESSFCDSVIRSLRRGDFLLLIVGDGIREGVGSIAEFLESHATLHFTFGLVEMAIYRMPSGSQLVQPRVLAQSAIFKRYVVRLEGEGISVSEDAAIEADEHVGADPSLEERARMAAKFNAFWNAYINRLTLDDKSQPIKPAYSYTNQYFNMPKGSNVSVSAYVAQSTNKVGVYLTFGTGAIGDRVYAALYADKDAINDALGVPVSWQSDGKKHLIVTRQSFSGDLIDPPRDEIIDWLTDRTNRFITVFRQRIQRIVDDSG